MSGHALLSPSSAYRWLNCTLAEIRAKKHFGKIQSDEAVNSLKNSSLWDDE